VSLFRQLAGIVSRRRDIDAERFAAAAVYRLLVAPAAWIHRRVEAVEFVDDRLVRRRVSLDFTVPTTLGGLAIDRTLLPFLPLTTLRKVPLRNFDLDGDDGVPLPVLTKAQNEVVIERSLAVLGEELVGKPLSDDVRRRLFRVVAGTPDEAQVELESWNGLTRQSGGDRAVWQALVADVPFMDYAQALAPNFVLLASADPMPGVRRIIKLAYDERPEPEVGLLKKVASSLGWRPTTFTFEASSVSFCASYHFEVAAPRDLEIGAARLELTDAATNADVTTPDPTPGYRAHLYTAGVAAGSKANVVAEIYARRSGLIRASLFVGALAFLMLLGASFHLDRIASPDQSQGATGLLLLVPTLLAAYIVRPGEHQLATTSLLGVRLAVAGAGASAVFASALIAAGYGTCEWFDRLWLIPLGASGVCTASLILSYVRPSDALASVRRLLARRKKQ
jgi:hypothetical protein